MNSLNLSTLICLVVLLAMIGGGWLWWNSYVMPTQNGDGSVPNAYTKENVRRGEIYHVEQNGEVQDFEVISVHWSGYLYVEVTPPDGEELDRDRPRHQGWVRELPSNRLIEARHLLRELPEELRYAPSYN